MRHGLGLEGLGSKAISQSRKELPRPEVGLSLRVIDLEPATFQRLDVALGYGRFIVRAQASREDSDLMLVKNFRIRSRS